ncbi:MAG TPA: GNAT family N-acetyltransferase [Blastocatellia bacterium]|nr:GNAT family N-acetyltransferase [Blastocatellia bacterium]
MKSEISNRSITLRPAGPDDELFLYELYCSTRSEELAAWNWPEEQQEAFLQMQFRARQQHYRNQEADDRIILLGERPVGRITVIRTEPEIRLADVALLPADRNSGLGSALIRELQAETAATNRPLRLHVLVSSPAGRLYERLGFSAVSSDGMYRLMEWLPKNAAAT